MEESQIVLSPPLPADEEGPEPIVPTRRPLHDPAARSPAHTAEQRRLASAPNVRLDAAGPHGRLGIGIVVPVVEAEVTRSTWATWGPEDDGIEDSAYLPRVVAVRRGDRGGQRDAPAVGQEMALDPAFGAVRGVRPRLGPPLGAFTMAVSSEAQRHWMRRWAS